MKLPARSPYEKSILSMIAAGYRLDDMVDAGAWTVHDVMATLRRHGLTADDTGRIQKARSAPDPVIELALHSPSQHVRTKALRAVALLKDLAVDLAKEQEQRDEEAERARQRQSVNQWLEWLKAAQAEARIELRRLNPNSKTPKETKAA